MNKIDKRAMIIIVSVLLGVSLAIVMGKSDKSIPSTTVQPTQKGEENGKNDSLYLWS